MSMDINSAARLIDSLPVWDKLSIRILTANVNFVFYFLTFFRSAFKKNYNYNFNYIEWN